MTFPIFGDCPTTGNPKGEIHAACPFFRFSVICVFSVFTVFGDRNCQMLSNAVKYCKYLIIRNFFLETRAGI